MLDRVHFVKGSLSAMETRMEIPYAPLLIGFIIHAHMGAVEFQS